MFEELYDFMCDHGFTPASLGTDSVNGQGNALWLAVPPTGRDPAEPDD